MTDYVALAQNLTREKFETLLKTCADTYYNGTDEIVISDEVYDKLIEIFFERFGVPYTSVGAPVHHIKVKLPRFVGSLAKIKNQKAIEQWQKKFPGKYLVSDKIDGLSILTNGTVMYTRGDGVHGSDISHLLPYLNVPKLPLHYWNRGEIVMPIAIFEKKYASEKANARVAAAGIVSSKTIDPERVKDLRIYAYELFSTLDDNVVDDFQSKQLSVLKNRYKFMTPAYEILDEISEASLLELLLERKLQAKYEMDGLVIMDESSSSEVKKGGHVFDKDRKTPKHAMAFKMEGGPSSETIVEWVEWKSSIHSLSKPRVHFKAVELNGSKVMKTTGYNGKFILDNKVGPGSRVIVTLCGTVIPNITRILSPSTSGEASMPDEWTWYQREAISPCDANTSIEDILAAHSNVCIEDVKVENRNGQDYFVWHTTSEVDISGQATALTKIISFFKTLKAKYVAEASLSKLFNNGYDTLNKIFHAKVEDIVEIEGIKEKGATRLLESVKRSITNVPLSKIAVASRVFGIGIGVKKLEKIFTAFPDILNDSTTVKHSKLIQKIQGLGGFDQTALQIVCKLGDLKQFLDDHPVITLSSDDVEEDVESKEEKQDDEEEDDVIDYKKRKLLSATKSSGGPLKKKKKKDTKLKSSVEGMKFAFSGFRDEKLKDLLVKNGAFVTDTVTKKTTALIVKEPFTSASTSKEKNAEKFGIQIQTLEEFLKEYLY